MKTHTATVEELALEYTESFINGNRKFIIREIQQLPTNKAIAVTAKVTAALKDDLQQDFIALSQTLGTF